MGTAEIFRKLLSEELVLHRSIQARVDEFRAHHFDSRAVGVHVRLSDKRVRMRSIVARLDALLARDKDLRVFVATDNIEAKEMLERRYQGVITTPHWYPAPGTPLHDNWKCPDRTESGIEALVDMYLLGSCDYLVGDTSSSFARVAGLLLPKGQDAILDVKPRTTVRARLGREFRLRYRSSNSVMARLLRRLAKPMQVQHARALLFLARVVPRHGSDRDD
jgi:hypothetical protein